MNGTTEYDHTGTEGPTVYDYPKVIGCTGNGTTHWCLDCQHLKGGEGCRQHNLLLALIRED